MKFLFCQNILQPRVIGVCRILSQATESLIWVKEDTITSVETRFWNLVLLEGMWPAQLSQESVTPFSAPCATGAHCLSCFPWRKWQPKSTAALGTTASFWQTCMKDEYGLLTSRCCGELWKEWLIICCISSRRETAGHFLAKWHLLAL